MEMVDNKRPFKIELKQRYITFRDMDHYWDDPDGGNKKQCDVSSPRDSVARGEGCVVWLQSGALGATLGSA